MCNSPLSLQKLNKKGMGNGRFSRECEGGGGLDKRGDDLNYKKYVRIWS